ncbi:MAG: universal stress protein [Syntrophobacteraceae bacterium]|jgi:nucleotide-binding universal stress UspA family protein|nr:universal stress protein [Syntrophobacteraceae bacterium]
MAYQCIVCGVTGSAHAQSAALEAAILAKEHHARLVYVYAVDTSFLRGGVASQSGVQTSLVKLGNHILDMAEELARAQGVTPVKVVRKGSVLEVLKAVVMEEKADLLMLGHEKRTMFEKALFHGEVEDHIRELEQQTGASVKVIN